MISLSFDLNKAFDGVPHSKLFKKMRSSRKLAWCKRGFSVRSQERKEGKQTLVEEILTGVLSGCSCWFFWYFLLMQQLEGC